MKIIGLIGGTTWESTKEYYRIINETVHMAKGGDHSAKLLLYSVDFHEIRELSKNNDWNSIADLLISKGKKLENSGAELLLICANTLHKVYDNVQKELRIPIIHIVDVLAKEIKKTGFSKIGLLGTKITMESSFYRSRLKDRFSIETITPEEDEREIISQIIFQELAKGTIMDSSRIKLLSIINKMTEKGAQGIVLGCTELSLILQPSHLNIPVFDTLLIHAASSVNLALEE